MVWVWVWVWVSSTHTHTHTHQAPTPTTHVGYPYPRQSLSKSPPSYLYVLIIHVLDRDYPGYLFKHILTEIIAWHSGWIRATRSWWLCVLCKDCAAPLCKMPQGQAQQMNLVTFIPKSITIETMPIWFLPSIRWLRQDRQVAVHIPRVLIMLQI